MPHVNLHEHGSMTEVRSAVARDYKRDSGRVQLWDVITVAALYWLVRDWPADKMTAAFALAAAATTALRTFIDQSNRNWWLHRINWEEQAMRETDR